MRLSGRVWKDGKFWLIEVPMLDAMTQGRTKKEAFEMMIDLVETMVDKPGFEAQVYAGKKEVFDLGSQDTAALLALVLRQQRQKEGLSLADMANRLGVKSRNAYARYEQGTSVPTVEKLAELLQAVSPNRDLVIAQSDLGPSIDI